MTTSSLVFIDARVSGYENLINDLPSDAEVVVLDSHTDGLEQIAAYLSGRTDIAAIHVLSHGSQGALYLGNARVDGAYLTSNSARLASIGSSLTEAGDILLYGCNVAQGDVGLKFIQSLASLTGADVAASIDATGAAALGGNSVLEAQSGAVQTLALDTNGLGEVLVGNTAPTFMVGDGMLTTDFASGNDYGSSVTVQADGKILVAGGSNSDVALARYNSDGSLDTSFSSDGKVTTDFGSSTSDGGRSVTVQADGKILVAGGSNSDVALARYNSDGSLDTSFSSDGKVTTDFASGNDSGSSVTVQADGKILVAGYSRTANGYHDFGLMRYNSDGSLDTSFDRNVSSLGGSLAYTENAPAVVLDSDVQIYDAELAAVGYGNAVLTLARHGGAQAEDQFSGAGILAGQSSGDVSVGGTTVGIYTWNAGTLRIVFNSNTTQELLNQTAQAIRYQNTSDNPASSIQIDWTFSDGNTGSQGTGEALETTDSMTVNITAVNDAPSGSMTLTGTATQGQTLTAANTLADVDGLGTVTYQWKANGTAITGATGTTYTLGQADVGKTISVTASYTDGRGTAEAITSSATTAVANVNDTPTGTVTLTGTATQGQTLIAANNLADVDGLDTIVYQWKANGTAITGATGSTYTLSQGDVGKTISVTASYTDAQGTAEAVTSATTVAVANVNDAPTGNVTLSGTATQGQTLTAANNLADADGFLNTIGYQWKANGTAITGATGSTYTLGQAEVGKTISVTASYTDAQGTAEAVTSAATTAVTSTVNTITGNSNNNMLLSAVGDDAIDGGAGIDTVSYANATAAVNVSLASRTAQDTEGAGVDTLLSIENLTGSRYDDILTGNAAANVLNGGAGADTMTGGNGNDTYYVNHASDLVNEALAGGTDTVYSTLLAYTLRANVEKGVVQGTVGGNLTGNALANTLTGNAAANQLNGSAGNDTLNGNAGNDTLIGGAGKDALTGGTGNDVFKFNTVAESGLTATTRDVIADFVRGQDKIDISTIDANTALTGNQAFTGLIGANVAFTKAGQLKLVAGVLYGNTDADATAEFSIALTGITTLANTDFVL